MGSMVKNFLKLQLFIILLASGSILNADPYSLANVSQYLTNLKLLKANFLQFNADGTTSSGVIFIKRPGRMRFEYYKPDKTLALVSAGALAIFDPKGDEAPAFGPCAHYILVQFGGVRFQRNCAGHLERFEFPFQSRKY